MSTRGMILEATKFSLDRRLDLLWSAMQKRRSSLSLVTIDNGDFFGAEEAAKWKSSGMIQKR